MVEGSSEPERHNGYLDRPPLAANCPSQMAAERPSLSPSHPREGTETIGNNGMH